MENNEPRRVRTPGRLALLALLALAGAGCGARAPREIHATNHYYHHLEGTRVVTHARYR